MNGGRAKANRIGHAMIAFAYSELLAGLIIFPSFQHALHSAALWSSCVVCHGPIAASWWWKNAGPCQPARPLLPRCMSNLGKDEVNRSPWIVFSFLFFFLYICGSRWPARICPIHLRDCFVFAETDILVALEETSVNMRGWWDRAPGSSSRLSC